MKSRTVTSLSTLAFTLLLTTACQEDPVSESGEPLFVDHEIPAESRPETEAVAEPELEEAFIGAFADEENNLMWMRCEHGLSYSESVNLCVGVNIAFEYCHSQDNSCNGESDQGELEPNTESALFEACNSLNEGEGTGGFADWRVPNVDELVSLYDAIYMADSDLLPSPRPSWYWTSTSETNRNALMVSFENGEVGSYPKRGQYPVRCVRDL